MSMHASLQRFSQVQLTDVSGSVKFYTASAQPIIARRSYVFIFLKKKIEYSFLKHYSKDGALQHLVLATCQLGQHEWIPKVALSCWSEWLRDFRCGQWICGCGYE
jgi:hypothetical protein